MYTLKLLNVAASFAKTPLNAKSTKLFPYTRVSAFSIGVKRGVNVFLDILILELITLI